MTSLELVPENKAGQVAEKPVQKLTPEQLDEKYLVTTLEAKKRPSTPEINLEKMPKIQYYWHATMTGENCEIIDNILTKGLKPKEEIDIENIGNHNTPEGRGVYVSDKGEYTAHYLKNSLGYNYNVGGLPTFIAVKVEEKNLEYMYDTDLINGDGPSIEDAQNYWFSLFLAHENVDDYLSTKMTVSHGQSLQQKLASLKGRKTSECKNEAWEILNSMTLEMKEDEIDLGIMNNSQIARFLKNIDIELWDKFLAILNKINPKKTALTGNLSKKNGFEAEDLKRVYTVTPNGDKDWRKWAKLIPPEIANKWDEWGTLKDKDGNQIPGNGKMIRIK